VLNPFLLFAKLYLLRFCFYRPKSKMAADRRLGKFWVAISPKRVIQSTSCLVLWRDFRDWRIDRRLRFDQIQDDAHGRHMCHKVLHYPENSSPMNASQCSARFTGSHHEYTLSEPSAVVNSTDWLQLTPTDSTLSPMEGARPQVSSTPGKSVYWPFLLDQLFKVDVL